MLIKKHYTAFQMALWTQYETFLFFLIITLWTAFYYFFDIAWLRIPWTPLALIGTAVAFVIGFQNNAAYGRIWEARKIWGGIVNASRTFGMLTQDMLTNEHAKNPMSDSEIQNEVKVLMYRHIAWITALRYTMRSSRPWETFFKNKSNRRWGMYPPELEKDASLHKELEAYISKSDLEYISTKDNKQTALLYLQSHHLRKLKERGIIWEFSFLELEGLLRELLTLQGKSERIKNFPYPRQFATLNHFFMWIFILLLPLAIVPQFYAIGKEFTTTYPLVSQFFVWLCIPFYVIVAWIFHTMERIGRTGENPFEGTANDVPISTMARGIEIDLRQNMGESKDQIPDQFPVKLHIQY